jgi:hypothetical protein
MSRVLLKVGVVLSSLVMFAAVPNVGAQSPASNKAFMLAGTNSITLTGVGAADGGVIILSAPGALKTSTNGAVSASLSLECAIWTYTQNVVTTVYDPATRKSSGSSLVTAHAGVEVWVEIDGQMAEPGKVVYCDRLQAVGLSIVNQCDLLNSDGTVSTTNYCTVTDTVTLDLFQATKNANSFNFYLGPLGTSIHNVVAKAQGFIECSKDGANVPCPATILNSFANAHTAAAIGKRTVIVEEQQNWGSDEHP